MPASSIIILAGLLLNCMAAIAGVPAGTAFRITAVFIMDMAAAQCRCNTAGSLVADMGAGFINTISESAVLGVDMKASCRLDVAVLCMGIDRKSVV